MATSHAYEERRLSHRNKADAMMNTEVHQSKFIRGSLPQTAELMFRHCPVRLIFDPDNLRVSLRCTHHPPEIHDPANFQR